MKLSKLAVLCCFAASGAWAAGPHWEYEGHHGPAHWGEMSKDFEVCGLGKHQSPIDIRKAEMKADLPELAFDYAASPLKIINNGHTVQVNIDAGGGVKIGDHVYRLVQFHFHTPSEERIKGKPADMVAHLVHKDDAGKLAVVAVLIKKGKENAALKPVFDNMPIGAGPVHGVEGLSINAADLLPAKHGYYHFEGSLTTPPCSEGVRWYVLSTPVEASADQIKAFQKIHKHNARPVQPLNDRSVVERAG
ncbi:MAG: carbonic anhydrase family protein [Gallionellaceae bacterium]|nr:carbonic anhydrase family protein [Gallionellaceae bacterium]